MKVLGIVSEYNPFHNGHLLQIKKSKEELNATHVVAIMSGSFTQRGIPSVIDKWSKANIALLNGVDLVVELPVFFSCSNAEVFSKGAIKLLNETNSIDYLSFGAEDNNIEKLNLIADIYMENSETLNLRMKNNLKQGLSYLKSMELSLSEIYPTLNVKEIISKSNNILAIEYLKALKFYNSKITPYPIKRIGPLHNSRQIHENITSASNIRNLLVDFNYKKNIIKELVPPSSFSILSNFYNRYDKFVYYNDFLEVLKYKIIIEKNYDNYIDYENGLENRLFHYLDKSKNIYELIDNIHSKRYTKSRISRFLNNILLDLKKNDIDNALNSQSNYIRILGSNKKGFEIINKIRKNSELQVIEKFSKVNKIKKSNEMTFPLKEIEATNIYNIALNNPLNQDYKTPIIIK